MPGVTLGTGVRRDSDWDRGLRSAFRSFKSWKKLCPNEILQRVLIYKRVTAQFGGREVVQRAQEPQGTSLNQKMQRENTRLKSTGVSSNRKSLGSLAGS